MDVSKADSSKKLAPITIDFDKLTFDIVIVFNFTHSFRLKEPILIPLTLHEFKDYYRIHYLKGENELRK